MSRAVVWSLCVLLAAPAAASPVSLVSRADSALLSDTGGALSSTDLGLSSQISADGRYTVFSSEAGNLVPGQIDTNANGDVFLHDRVAGTTVLVSHRNGSAVTAGNSRSFHPAISDDGRYIAFLSLADDLIAGQDLNGNTDAFLYDRMTGTVTLVSHSAASATTAGDGRAQDVAISADGNTIAFAGDSTNLVSGQVSPDNGSSLQVFLYDRAAGTLSLASHASGSPTTAGFGGSSTPALSDDGRYVAYTSNAVDLIAGGIDGAIDDVYLYDRTTGANVLVSHAHGSAVTSADGDSIAPRISADGRYVAYMSLASNLVAGVSDSGGRYDVFLFDRDAGTSVLVSHAAGAATTPGGGISQLPRLSDDGAWLVFKSSGQDMVAGETSSGTQIFLYERATGTISFVPAGAAAATPGAGGLHLEAEISGDGNFVVFTSASPDLVPGQTDTNSLLDVFLYNRTGGTVLLVSHAASSATTAGNGSGLWPDVSHDGGVVAFTSPSSDLVAGLADTNRVSDVFVYDRATGTNTAASRRASGLPSVSGNDDSGATVPGSAVSADGRWVAFASEAGNLVPGQVDVMGNLSNVFLHDRETGATALVSHAAGSTFTEAAGLSIQPAISADGRFVAFQSTAADLVSGQVEGNSAGDIFLYNREDGTVTLVSRTAASAVTTGSGGSEAPAISADGRFVAFQSLATNLVSGQTDGNSGYDVFLFDRTAGTAVLVSRSAGSATTTGNGVSTAPLLSADGTRLAFLSAATDLVPGQVDTNSLADLFLYAVGSGATTLVSHAAGLATTAGDGLAGPFSLSADGSWIAFVSLATNLAAGQTDTNVAADVFLFERSTLTITLLSHAAGSPTTAANGQSFVPRLSADGGWVAFMSSATNLIPGQTNATGEMAVFLRELATGATRLVSHAAGAPSAAADGASEVFGIDSDGRHVVFASKATNLVTGQEQGFPASLFDLSLEGWNVFLYDRETGESLLASRALSSPLLTGDKDSEAPVLSADASTVVFRSAATDLIAGDYNQREDLFAYDNGLPGRFYTLTPCRLLDTRQPQDGPALASEVTATFHLHGACGIPETAKAVAVNVTVTQPTGLGHLTLSAGDAPVPAVSTINFGPGQTRANNAVLRLAGNATGQLAARPFVAGGGTVHVILDVTGYFE